MLDSNHMEEENPGFSLTIGKRQITGVLEHDGWKIQADGNTKRFGNDDEKAVAVSSLDEIFEPLFTAALEDLARGEGPMGPR